MVITPGALFPHSQSMDPELSHTMAHHLHFPAKASYKVPQTPLSGPSSSPERSPLPTRCPTDSARDQLLRRPGGVARRLRDGFFWDEAPSSPRLILAVRSGMTLLMWDTSSSIRVRGKEREKQVSYGNKIKKLEEEVKRFREEVWVFSPILFILRVDFCSSLKASEETRNKPHRLLVLPSHASASAATTSR